MSIKRWALGAVAAAGLFAGAPSASATVLFQQTVDVEAWYGSPVIPGNPVDVNVPIGVFLDGYFGLYPYSKGAYLTVDAGSLLSVGFDWMPVGNFEWRESNNPLIANGQTIPLWVTSVFDTPTFSLRVAGIDQIQQMFFASLANNTFTVSVIDHSHPFQSCSSPGPLGDSGGPFCGEYMFEEHVFLAYVVIHVDRNFTWTVSDTAPVPEPETWSLLIGGLGFAGAALRSRRRRFDSASTAT